MQFTAQAESWLSSNPAFIFGKTKLGSGRVGSVYALDNNPDLVIKVPRTATLRPVLKAEAEQYKHLQYLRIIAPMYEVKQGLIRPNLRTSPEDLKGLSREQLEDLRESLIDLSAAGYNVLFNLQLGIDSAGNVLIYDIGKESLMLNQDKHEAYERNNRAFALFLYTIGKRSILSYGEVKPP